MNKLHPLYCLFNQPTLPIESLSIVDQFKLQICQNIISTYLLYPTLQYITFDFEEIKRISEVWEGSDEEIIQLGYSLWDSPSNIEQSDSYKEFSSSFPLSGFSDYIHHVLIKQKFNKVIPSFLNISDALANEQAISPHSRLIQLLSPQQSDINIRNIFNYLTEEPSFLKELLKEHSKTKLETVFQFSNPFLDNQFHHFEVELLNFAGQTLKTSLTYHSLESSTYLHTYHSKNKLAKI